MMKIIKKNQLTILVLALMLVTAGYLNYNSTQNVATGTQIASLGDATLVSSNSIVEDTNNVVSNSTENTVTTNSELVENTTENSTDNNIKENENNSVTTNAEAENKSDYYTTSRLEREKMYSQMLDSNQKILDSTTTSNKQKEAAQKEITKVNNTKNAVMITENLIKTKGFEDCIVYANEKSIDVVIKKDKLKKEDTAQIQSIVAREMNVKIANIHIMTK